MGHYARNEGTKTGKRMAFTTGQYLDLTIPYWFSRTARLRQENLLPGDYVTVRGLEKEKKFELIDIYPQFGSCRVRLVGETSCLLMPWAYLSPWKEKRTSALTQALGNWLFGRNLVYRLSEPDRMLKQKKIHWDRQTCDVEDEDGTVFYDVSWDELEFWDPVECRLPVE
jgi:hypothetical protein